MSALGFRIGASYWPRHGDRGIAAMAAAQTREATGHPARGFFVAPKAGVVYTKSGSTGGNTGQSPCDRKRPKPRKNSVFRPFSTSSRKVHFRFRSPLLYPIELRARGVAINAVEPADKTFAAQLPVDGVPLKIDPRGTSFNHGVPRRMTWLRWVANAPGVVLVRVLDLAESPFFGSASKVECGFASARILT